MRHSALLVLLGAGCAAIPVPPQAAGSLAASLSGSGHHPAALPSRSLEESYVSDSNEALEAFSRALDGMGFEEDVERFRDFIVPISPLIYHTYVFIFVAVWVTTCCTVCAATWCVILAIFPSELFGSWKLCGGMCS